MEQLDVLRWLKVEGAFVLVTFNDSAQDGDVQFIVIVNVINEYKLSVSISMML